MLPQYLLWASSAILLVSAQGPYNQINPNDPNYYYVELKCPEHWIQYQQSCYKFVRSPLRAFYDARKICESFSIDTQYGYGSDLVSIGSLDEHGFLTNHLNRIDPKHHLWYLGAQQQSPNYWVNPDGTQLINMENAFLPEQDYNRFERKEYLAYNFSREIMHWGFQPVKGEEMLMFICEGNVAGLQRLVTDDDRSVEYGIEVDDPEKVPRGPYFIKQPEDFTFDTFASSRKLYNDVTLSCLAGGYPTPTYQWFREDYENDRLTAKEINPLLDSRYTISGGNLIINNPVQVKDRATYHCKATNKFGTVISESVHLNFGFIWEFVLKRSPEIGDQNWGKAIYCDPPSHYPAVKYYWSRDYFPNFVEEDNRIFVSHDGALYFSALEFIDKANYSCSVKAEFSDTGRNGPFFDLWVNPHCK